MKKKTNEITEVALSARTEGQIAAVALVLRQLLDRLPREEQDTIRQFVEGRFTANDSVELAEVRESAMETFMNIFTSATPE